MKRSLTLIFILFSIVSCKLSLKNQSKVEVFNLGKFKVTIDTIFINIKSYLKCDSSVELTHAVLFDDDYYLIFYEKEDSQYHMDTKHCFKITSNGVVEKSILIPKVIQNSFYFDLFVLHDSLYLKAYMDNNTYYFDNQKSAWIETKEAEDLISEDNDYKITYINYGEWGVTTWFIDKKTKNEYELCSNGTIINRLDNKYYITNSNRVLMIDNPTKLDLCDQENKYENHSKRMNGCISKNGAMVIYKDTSRNERSFNKNKVRIVTSFVVDNQLYHLCVDSCSTFIANIDSGNIHSLYRLGNDYSIFNWNYSYRCKIQKDKSQLLKFKTENKDLFGLIEIKENLIKIRYIKIIK